MIQDQVHPTPTGNSPVGKLLTYEESVEKWRAKWRAEFPNRTLAKLFLVAWLGTIIVSIITTAKISGGLIGLIEFHPDRLVIHSLALAFFAGLAMLFYPLLYLGLVHARVGPRPTREDYEKTRALMRMYEAVKQEFERQELDQSVASSTSAKASYE